jgi:hypothetical protein
MSDDSVIYDVEWIKTARYRCKVCHIYASVEDFLNNEPCRSCNNTRLGKQGKKKIPIYNVRVTSIDRKLRSYQEYTMKKIEDQRKLGFIVEIQ